MSVSRVYRLLRLITLLQTRGGYSATELANELEVSRRTIFRDLNMLEMARIPYYFDPDRGGYRISSHFFLPPVNLTLTEALAVLLLTRRGPKAGQVPLLSQGARAAVKLESALPKAIREHVGSVMDRMSFSTGPLSKHEGLDAMFDELAEATARRKVCRIVYISFHERKQIQTTIHPLRLMFIGRAWYLIAHSAKHRQVRTFKLARIRKCILTGRTFETPKDADPGEYLGDAWQMIPEGRLYDVHLRFAPKVAGNVAEVRWHHSQRVDFNDDGSADFRAKVDGLGEITWWILGYGDQVEVLSPPELRARVAETAQSMLGMYTQKGR